MKGGWILVKIVVVEEGSRSWEGGSCLVIWGVFYSFVSLMMYCLSRWMGIIILLILSVIWVIRGVGMSLGFRIIVNNSWRLKFIDIIM